MGLRFTSPQEAIDFVDWLGQNGISRAEIVAAGESDFRGAQEFFGLALLVFRAGRDQHAALESVLPQGRGFSVWTANRK